MSIIIIGIITSMTISSITSIIFSITISISNPGIRLLKMAKDHPELFDVGITKVAPCSASGLGLSGFRV